MATMRDIIDKWSYDERLARTERARTAVTHRGGYCSAPERRVQKCLLDLDVNAMFNVMKWKYSWDAIFANTIVEVQGTMWHAKPTMYKEDDLIMGKILAKDIWNKDARKKQIANDNGYTVIEIWEDEINSCKTDDALLELVNLKLNGVHNA